MASTFSPTLRIELIGDGDQSGIWGQTTNSNLGTLIEQAITGVVTITMTDANYTLTSFNGVADEARNAVIVATGALSQQRNIIAPLVEKIYTIRNSTSGGFAVQIIGASGTGVVIPNGVTASVYCDGTNFNPLQVNSIGNQTVNGNLVVTGTTNLTGALTASTATFSGTVALGGTPTAPTAAPGTNTTQIATTAFVQNIASSLGTMSTQNANNVAITGGTMSGMTSIAGGTISGTTGTFSGAVSGTTGTFSGAVSGTTGTFSGAMSAASLAGSAATGSGASGTWSINITGNSVTTNNVASGGTIASNVTATTQPVSTNNTTVATTAFVRSIIPAGVILMWSGSIASIPSGWLLCDGTNGTPDLRSRFIVGAGSAYGVGSTGGSADAIVVSHNHTGTTSTVGNHQHYIFGDGVIGGTPLSSSPNSFARIAAAVGQGGMANENFEYNIQAAPNTPYGGLTSANGSHNHTFTTDTTGSSGTNANLPPYYALAYIMKS